MEHWLTYPIATNAQGSSLDPKEMISDGRVDIQEGRATTGQTNE
jgi:hypothetical protein